MKVYINYQDSRWKKYKIDFEKIANAVVGKNYKNSEVSITLIDDKEIHKLNKDYRSIDKATNVLSFELQDDILLGDIFISLDTVKREAKDLNISVEDHTAHMVVHGVLHLLGYDHIKDDEAEVMEKTEVKILKKLGIKNPYMADLPICSDSSCCPGSKFLSFFKKIKIKEDGVFQNIILFVLGAVASLGFAPFNMWWATLIAVAAAYKFVVRANKVSWIKSFLRILPFSAAYSMAMFWWVLNSIYVVPELAAEFAIWTVPALFGIGILGGVIFAIPFVLISRMCTFPPCRPILFASFWTFVLWLREWFLTGFPWNPVANIFMPFPVIANSMSLWGALGLSFIIIGLVASVVELLTNYKSKLSWVVFFIFCFLFALGAFAGYKNIQAAHLQSDNNYVIRIVQPAESAVQKATHSRQEALRNAEINIRNLVELASAPGDFDLLVFPETSYPFVVLDGDKMPIAEYLNKPVIIGAQYYSAGKMFNSMVVADNSGKINKIYSKSHLVPFGEYRPLGDIIPTPGQLSKGAGAELMSLNLNTGSFAFAPAICYEIIFSDSLIPSQQNPDMIINITNDTWFGNTPGTYQHLDMVRRYAIESGMPIVRANYSGISAFISSDGEIISYLSVGQAGYLDGFVWGAHNTVYRTIGRDGWMIIILLFSIFLCVPLGKFNKLK